MAFAADQNFYGGKGPLYHPAYTVPEAAHYLRMPPATLRSWVLGRDYPTASATKRSKPLIAPDDPAGRYLSFLNMVEAHVLASIRRHYGVRLPKVRIALRYVRDRFDIERPLINESFQTDGLDLFVERYGKLINASQQGQLVMKEIMAAYLKRIERDARGLPIRLYPFTRASSSDDSLRCAPKVVVINPLVSYGRPVIAGTGVPTAMIWERYYAGDSVAQLASDFRLDTSAIEEAIRCEAA